MIVTQYSCDPNANYNAPMTCTGLGFVGGSTNVSCTEDCRWDTSGCHDCGDGVCDDDEDPVSCAVDCGGP
jgi:hypothetical protein